MFQNDDLVLDCRTCVAANTTACSDCVVHHLLANDAGPIEFVPSPQFPQPTEADRAVALFTKAGLLDDPVHWVSAAEFESHGSPQLTTSRLLR
jgi:hypothetical protein